MAARFAKAILVALVAVLLAVVIAAQNTNVTETSPAPAPQTTTPAPTPYPTVAQTTASPTDEATPAPTKLETDAPTKQPTVAPTKRPTVAPTKRPTDAPTKLPTASPTKLPSAAPTEATIVQAWNTIQLANMLSNNTSRACMVRRNETAAWESANCTALGLAASEDVDEVTLLASSQGDGSAAASSSSGDNGAVVVTADMAGRQVYDAEFAVCTSGSEACMTGEPDIDVDGNLVARLDLDSGKYNVILVAQVSPLTEEQVVLLVRSERLLIDTDQELGEGAIFVSEQMQRLGIALASISWATILLLGLWQFHHRSHRIILIGQSDLLFMILFGATVSTATILLFAIPSSKACQATSWTYTLGFAITFAGIIGKLWRAHKIFNNRYMKVRRNVRRNLVTGAMLVILIDLLILVIWTVIDPLSLQDRIGEDDMVYVCTSDSAWIFAGLVLVNHGALLVFGLCKAHEDRDLNRILSEARELRFVLAATIFVPVLVVPLLWVYFDQPDLRYALNSIVVFITNMSILAICFFPRMLHIHLYDTQEISLARPSHHERMDSLPDLSLQVGGRRKTEGGFAKPRILDSESSGKEPSSSSRKERVSGKIPDSLIRVAREVSTRLARPSNRSSNGASDKGAVGHASNASSATG